MKKLALFAAFSLSACVNASPEIILTNADGKQVSCGHYQSAAVNAGEYVAAANIANGNVNSCIEKYGRLGYGAMRQVPVAAYAALGPIHDAGHTGKLQGVVIAQGTKGKFGLMRPDGVTCEGSFVTTPGASTGLLVKYRDVIGLSVSTNGMLAGIALGSCSNGAQFQGEYYVVANTDNGFGVAADSDGNVYKVISQ